MEGTENPFPMRVKLSLTKTFVLDAMIATGILLGSVYGCGGTADGSIGLKTADIALSSESSQSTTSGFNVALPKEKDASQSEDEKLAPAKSSSRAIVWLTSMPSEVKHNDKKYNVMTVGDSITFGVGAISPSGGYREALRRVSFPVLSFVGSQSHGYSVVAPNEGYPGATIASLDSVVVPKLKTYSPDVVMVLAGVNNLSKRNPSYTGITQGLKDMATFLTDIKKMLPKTKILVSTLTPLAKNSDYASSADIKSFNTGLKAVASKAGAVLVDNYSNSSIGASDIGTDGIHPNDSGYAKIGKIWAKVVNSL
jgi:lysophospholipase L1-like esterase